MTLTVLLMLAGLAAADDTAPRSTAGAALEEPGESAGRAESFLATMRRKLGAAGRTAPATAAAAAPAAPAPAAPSAPAPTASPSPQSEEPSFGLTNRRTGVTCTMMIVPRKPSEVDARGILDNPGIIPVPVHPADGIVRNDLSPCVESGGAVDATGRRRR